MPDDTLLKDAHDLCKSACAKSMLCSPELPAHLASNDPARWSSNWDTSSTTWSGRSWCSRGCSQEGGAELAGLTGLPLLLLLVILVVGVGDVLPPDWAELLVILISDVAVVLVLQLLPSSLVARVFPLLLLLLVVLLRLVLLVQQISCTVSLLKLRLSCSIVWLGPVAQLSVAGRASAMLADGEGLGWRFCMRRRWVAAAEMREKRSDAAKPNALSMGACHAAALLEADKPGRPCCCCCLQLMYWARASSESGMASASFFRSSLALLVSTSSRGGSCGMDRQKEQSIS